MPALLIALLPAAASAAQLPNAGRKVTKGAALPGRLAPDMRRMIEAAIACRHKPAARNVLAIARHVAPGATAEIDVLEEEWRASIAAHDALAAAERMSTLRLAGPFDNWKGQI